MEEKQKALNGVVASLGTSKFNVPEVSIAEINANPENYVLVDVRSEEEISVSTIPGSVSKYDFEANPSKYSNKEVVCFCTVGYISAGYTCKYSSIPSEGITLFTFSVLVATYIRHDRSRI
jgi:hypothetical protein